MSAEKAILEALNRLEHKVDLTLTLVTQLFNTGGGPLILDHPGVADPKHHCPVCGQTPKFSIDFYSGVVTRSCGCGTGKNPVDLRELAPPAIQPRRHDDGDQRQGDGSNEQGSGGGGGGSRPGGAPGRGAEAGLGGIHRR